MTHIRLKQRHNVYENLCMDGFLNTVQVSFSAASRCLSCSVSFTSTGSDANRAGEEAAQTNTGISFFFEGHTNIFTM